MTAWRAAAAGWSLLMAAACSGNGGVSAEDARGFAPMTADTPAVAYLTLVNRGTAARRVTRVSSAQFARVALHETVLEDGVAQMRPLEAVRIEPGGELTLAPGGKHLMLMQPGQPVLPGTAITLVFGFADGGQLAVEVVLDERGAGSGHGG